MIKIVIDTNVFVSALNFGGTPRKVLNLVNEGIIELIISPFILAELSEVLSRQFNWAEDKVKSAIGSINEISRIVHLNKRLSIVKEKDSDNRILECAICGKANYIVSGDTRHLLPLQELQGIKILKPTEFLNIINV